MKNNTAHASYHNAKVEVRDAGGKGIGLFARETIQRGEVIVVTGGYLLTAEEFNRFEHAHLPFQVEATLHLAPIDPRNPDGIFAVNHACEPNAGIRGQTSLVALRTIQAGEEVAYDYVQTDSDADGVVPFEMRCLCGADSCRGVITDRDWRKPQFQSRYQGYFSSYLQARIANLSIEVERRLER